MSLTLSIDASTNATGWAVFDGPTLVESGVVSPKGTFFERALSMSSELRVIQARAIRKYGQSFSDIVIEKNNVGGVNQQSVMKIGIATGIILGKLVADHVYFVNVSTWRKHFEIKGKGKKLLKQQAIHHVMTLYGKQVKDDEADAILIGEYFQSLKGDTEHLEIHKLER